MPVERLGGDAERAIVSVLEQRTAFPFELILVSAVPLPNPEARVRNVIEINRNPATRRNRAVSVAQGDVLAFIDDDATAAPDWLTVATRYLEAHPEVLALGGPDPAPATSSVPEMISETLLRAPWIGSGIAAHEEPQGIFDVRSPSDLALVNLFVRRDVFSGFDESIGYIGEDTALIASLMNRGPVVYHSGVRVYHRRRPFPGPYLKQRWRYRVKTGRMLARGSAANRAKVLTFLGSGTAALLLLPITAPLYYIITFLIGARTTRLSARWWPLLPFAFALHHLTYFGGIVWGLVTARLRS